MSLHKVSIDLGKYVNSNTTEDILLEIKEHSITLILDIQIDPLPSSLAKVDVPIIASPENQPCIKKVESEIKQEEGPPVDINEKSL